MIADVWCKGGAEGTILFIKLDIYRKTKVENNV